MVLSMLGSLKRVVNVVIKVILFRDIKIRGVIIASFLGIESLIVINNRCVVFVWI